MLPIILVLLLSGGEAEDAAHRADRLRTQALNRDAAQRIEQRDGGNASGERAYRAASADYRQRLAAWRRQVDACRSGDWSACR